MTLYAKSNCSRIAKNIIWQVWMLGKLQYSTGGGYLRTTAPESLAKANASSSGEAFADSATSSQQTNPNRRLGPAMGARYFLDLVAFQIMALQDHAVILFASFQNAADVNGREVNFGRGGKFGERLQERFATHTTTMDIKRDAVHPSQNHVGIAQLTKPFPALHPRSLRSFLRCVIG
jgi:hypothetical protein